MQKSQIMKIKKELEYKDPYPAPFESGLPPLNSKLSFFHAATEGKVAETEVAVKKIFFKKQHMSVLWEWSILDEKKHTLRKLFKNSDKVILENKASVFRFREKIRENAADRVNLELQILHMDSDVQDYKKVIVEMEKYVNEYSIYETFLESVAQNATEFNSVRDILNRYESLEHARKDCANLLEKELEDSSELRKGMVDLMEEKSNQLKNLNNDLVLMQVRRKQAKERRTYWERTVERLKNIMKAREEELLVMAGGCWDLYCQMCAGRGVPVALNQRDIRAQLDFIQKTIVFYKEVNTIAAGAKQTQQGPVKL